MCLIWMIVFTLVGILSSGVSSQDLCGMRLGANAHNYIIGGKDAKRGDWPWQVVLMSDKIRGKSFCGGVLINDQWVATAAHCIWQSVIPGMYTVGLGYHNRRNTREHGRVDMKVARIIMNPGWDSPTLNNDIALLQLEKEVSYTEYISPACLPSRTNVTGENCFITGWGKMTKSGWMVSKLQEGEMEVRSNQECQRLNGNMKNITDAMLCAGDAGITSLSGCHGDSGGPFVCKIDGKWEAYGVVSWGPRDCSSTNKYTVFARLPYFKDWIQNNIAAYPTAPPPPKHNDKCGKFVVGDGQAALGEIHVVGLFSYSSCIEECFKRSLKDTRINGVTVASGKMPHCYCKIGMDAINRRDVSHKTCKLKSPDELTTAQPTTTSMTNELCIDMRVGDGTGGEGQVVLEGFFYDHKKCVARCHIMQQAFIPRINGVRLTVNSNSEDFGKCACEMGMTTVDMTKSDYMTCRLKDVNVPKPSLAPIPLPSNDTNVLCSQFYEGDGIGIGEVVFEERYTELECIDKCYQLSRENGTGLEKINAARYLNETSECICEIHLVDVNSSVSGSMICYLADLTPTIPPTPTKSPADLGCINIQSGNGKGLGEITFRNYHTAVDCIMLCKMMSNYHPSINGVRLTQPGHGAYMEQCICEIGMTAIDSTGEGTTCWLEGVTLPTSTPPPLPTDDMSKLCTNFSVGASATAHLDIALDGKHTESDCIKKCYSLSSVFKIGVNGARLVVDSSECVCEVRMVDIDPSRNDSKTCWLTEQPVTPKPGPPVTPTNDIITTAQTVTSTTGTDQLCGPFVGGDGKGGFGEVILENYFVESECIEACHNISQYTFVNGARFFDSYFCACEIGMTSIEYSPPYQSKTCKLTNVPMPGTPMPLPESRNKTGCFNMIGDENCNVLSPSSCSSVAWKLACAKTCGSCGFSANLCGDFENGDGGGGEAEVVLEGNYTQEECIKTCYILGTRQNQNINGVRIGNGGSKCVCEVGMTYINTFDETSKTCWITDRLCGPFVGGNGKGGLGEIILEGYVDESECIKTCHGISKNTPVNGARLIFDYFCACEIGMTRIEYSPPPASKTCKLKNLPFSGSPIPVPPGSRNETGCFNMIGDDICQYMDCKSVEMKLACAKACGTCDFSEKLCSDFKRGDGRGGEAEVVLEGNYTTDECIKTCYVLRKRKHSNVNGVRIQDAGSKCICEVGMTYIDTTVYGMKTCWLSGSIRPTHEPTGPNPSTRPTARPTGPTYWRTRWPTWRPWSTYKPRKEVVDFFLKLSGNITIH